MAVNVPVFFSWQSDSPVERPVIETALREAIAAVAADTQLVVRPELDHDTRGLPGAPAVVGAILAKIDRSAAFVADVTPTYSRTAGGSRRSPNPNVLFELGYAFKRLGTERIILVLNELVASPEALPFDLRGNRILSFVATEAVPPPGSNADFTTALETNLRLIVGSPPPDLLPTVSLDLRRTNRNIRNDRHEYRLVATATNASDEILSDWSWELEIPRAVLEPNQTYDIIVASRSSREKAVMRMTQARHSGQPLYPQETREILGIDYFMNDALYQTRGELFKFPVALNFFVGTKRVARTTRAFAELQNY